MLRGINQQQVFEDEADNQKFLQACKKASEKTSTSILAYCLMGNHVHILIESPSVAPSEFYRHLGANYVSWFNWKYERTGHLFQDRYKSEPVESESYLLGVINYIHNNPVKAGLVDRAHVYPWSSLHELQSTPFVIDIDRLDELVSVEEILACRYFEETPSCLENGRGRRLRYTDTEAKELIQSLIGVMNVSEFQELSKEEQHRGAILLRENKMPIRQITRLTGLSKGVVERLG